MTHAYTDWLHRAPAVRTARKPLPTWLVVTIADVSGKGIPAALFMAVSRTVMRNASAETDMAQRMADANRLLATDNTACMFVTMFSGVLDIETGRFIP